MSDTEDDLDAMAEEAFQHEQLLRDEAAAAAAQALEEEEATTPAAKRAKMEPAASGAAASYGINMDAPDVAASAASAAYASPPRHATDDETNEAAFAPEQQRAQKHCRGAQAPSALSLSAGVRGGERRTECRYSSVACGPA